MPVIGMLEDYRYMKSFWREDRPMLTTKIQLSFFYFFSYTIYYTQTVTVIYACTIFYSPCILDMNLGLELALGSSSSSVIFKPCNTQKITS